MNLAPSKLNLSTLAEELRLLLREVKEDVTTIEVCSHSVARRVSCIGKVLIKVKSFCGHGQWLKWLSDHCPEITERTANNYMRVARNPKLLSEMSGASLVQIYRACGIVTTAPKAKAGLISHGTVETSELFLNRLTKRLGPAQKLIIDIDAETLPAEGRQALAASLEPFVEIYQRLVQATPPPP